MRTLGRRWGEYDYSEKRRRRTTQLAELAELTELAKKASRYKPYEPILVLPLESFRLLSAETNLRSMNIESVRGRRTLARQIFPFILSALFPMATAWYSSLSCAP
jgi:hypothetical protein